MNILLANESHIPGLLNLLLQVGDVHHQLRPDIFREGAQKYNADALKELLKDEDRPVFVAEEAGNVLGYCFCVRKEFGGTACTQRREIYIDDLCVDEAIRGRGVATALYRHVTDYAKSLGCAFITLNVWTGNDRAQRFYEYMGLTPRSVTMEIALED